MNKVIINLEDFESKRKVHEYIKEQCNFPDYYGYNLDALYDCLCEDRNYEFEFINSIIYHEYQTSLVDTILDAGCKVIILPRFK